MTKPSSPDRDAASALRGFGESLPMELLRAREAVMAQFRPILADHNVTEQQWRVLRALQDADEPLSVGELVDRTHLLGPSLSRMLVTLQERSLIVRRPADDARRSEIVITRDGHDLVAAVAPHSEATYANISSQLEPGELDELYRLLAKVANETSG